jgi:hypothetical protein
MFATLVESAENFKQFVVIMTLAMVVIALVMKMIKSGSYYPGATVALFLVLIAGISTGMFTDIFGLLLGQEKPKHKPKIHISHEVWKYVGLVAAALLCIAVLYFIVKAALAWYNSPAKVEARAARNSEALMRIRQGLLDNPDYAALASWQRQLANRQSPETNALRAEISRLLEAIRSEEETAALAPIAEGLADIRFRNEPAERPE